VRESSQDYTDSTSDTFFDKWKKNAGNEAVWAELLEKVIS